MNDNGRANKDPKAISHIKVVESIIVFFSYIFDTKTVPTTSKDEETANVPVEISGVVILLFALIIPVDKEVDDIAPVDKEVDDIAPAVTDVRVVGPVDISV